MMIHLDSIITKENKIFAYTMSNTAKCVRSGSFERIAKWILLACDRRSFLHTMSATAASAMQLYSRRWLRGVELIEMQCLHYCTITACLQGWYLYVGSEWDSRISSTSTESQQYTTFVMYDWEQIKIQRPWAFVKLWGREKVRVFFFMKTALIFFPRTTHYSTNRQIVRDIESLTTHTIWNLPNKSQTDYMVTRPSCASASAN